MVGESHFSSKSALVLDDNPQMRAIMRSILGAMGIRSVVDFSDPRSAHHHLQSHHVDVALFDLVLNSDQDGLGLATTVRHDASVVNPTIPIILITGYASITVINQAINFGVDEIVIKPFRARDLVARVEKAIQRPRPYIRTPSGYFGPDRRRRDDPHYGGPERRLDDQADPVDTIEEARRHILRLRPDAFIEQRSIDETVVALID